MWGGGAGGPDPPSGKSQLALGILRNIGTDPTGALLLEGGSYFPLWDTLIKNVVRTPDGIFWICRCFNKATVHAIVHTYRHVQTETTVADSEGVWG